MTCFGMVRLSHNEIRLIIADHMSAKYSISIGPEKVGLYPYEDRYANNPYADVDMVGEFLRKTR